MAFPYSDNCLHLVTREMAAPESLMAAVPVQSLDEVGRMSRGGEPGAG